MPNQSVDLSQRIDIPGFSGTVEELLRQVEGDRTIGVSVAITPDLRRRVDDYAVRKGLRTRSAVIREALQTFFEREETAAYRTR